MNAPVGTRPIFYLSYTVAKDLLSGWQAGRLARLKTGVAIGIKQRSPPHAASRKWPHGSCQTNQAPPSHQNDARALSS